MNYSETIEFLFNSFPLYQNIGAGAYKEGLGNINAMCTLLGNPERNFFTIHVAGTNGKGSVAHSIAAVLQSAGYCVGLFTSPHLVDFRERIRVDGEMIGEQAVTNFVARYRDEMMRLGLSFFEMTTAMAFDYFSESDVEVAVIETGMGGRLDATNVITPILSVITNIGRDHMQFLGDTIGEIAAEKAGIIKHEVPVVVGESDPESSPVFMAKASQMEAPIVFADCEWTVMERVRYADHDRYSIQRPRDGRTQEIDFDLQGECQARNIVTIRTAISVLRHQTHLNISTRALLTGLASVAATTGLRGRWQKIGERPLTICDAGHNAHAIKYIAGQLADLHPAALHIVWGMVADKDVDAVARLMPREAHYYFTAASVRRAMPAAELAARFAASGLHGEVVEGVGQAVERARAAAAPDDVIFIGGSCFVVADLLK
ncbi:MAG: folylpolyglutamate synthase/dihydrofolate synthase family protein [Tidjanibacter sp.]|nr:folylpolyglutamate synthase/dihydrofolate synthase family protein [Tidjanibacter sp.]